MECYKCHETGSLEYFSSFPNAIFIYHFQDISRVSAPPVAEEAIPVAEEEVIRVAEAVVADRRATIAKSLGKTNSMP